MCVTAWVNDEELASPRELRAALGSVVSTLTPEDERVMRQHTKSHGYDLDDCCLCHIDIPASAEAAGWSWDFDGIAYELFRRED